MAYTKTVLNTTVSETANNTIVRPSFADDGAFMVGPITPQVSTTNGEGQSVSSDNGSESVNVFLGGVGGYITTV